MKLICSVCGEEMETTSAMTHYITRGGKVSANKASKPVKGVCNNPKCPVAMVELGYEREEKPEL